MIRRSEFGTGAVKITPAHDFNDYKSASAMACEPINISGSTAHQ